MEKKNGDHMFHLEERKNKQNNMKIKLGPRRNAVI